MSECLTLLSFYYMCDAAAMERSLSPTEIIACSRSYEEVKMYFAGLDPMPIGTADMAARNRDAYRAFKDWEAQNEALVADLKRDARG